MKFKKLSLCLGFVFAASILTSLSHAQNAPKTTSPQPVNVVNTPTVTVSNSSLPVSGSVTVNNSSIPVSGNVQVSNLPLDANGDVRVSESKGSHQFEYKHAVFYLCDPNPDVQGWEAHLDLCASNPNVDATPADSLLSTLSTQGWQLVNVSGFSWTPCTGCTSMVIKAGVLYTFRRPLQ